jgi:hypothetical protein
MLSPLLICIGILAILVYNLYGSPQDKDRLQVFLSAVVCTWFSIGLFWSPDSPRVDMKVVEYPAPAPTQIVTPRTHHDENVKIDPSLIHSAESSLDCDAPLQTAEMHSSGCAGGCVNIGSTPSNVCYYAGSNECIGNIKHKIRRHIATTYRSTYYSRPLSDDDPQIKFRWPARGRIIQGYEDGGDGINIALKEGSDINAVEDGEIAFAGNELKGYGNMILLRHPNGFVSAYAHNNELLVKRGDKVKRGQIIAKSGQTGIVRSPQLHFELRKGSTPVDPILYLAGF